MNNETLYFPSAPTLRTEINTGESSACQINQRAANVL